jgi:hypothetical protein
MNYFLSALAPAAGANFAPWVVVLIKLIVVGLILYICWILIQKIPLEPTIRQVVNVVFTIIVVLVVLYLVLLPLLGLL